MPRPRRNYLPDITILMTLIKSYNHRRGTVTVSRLQMAYPGYVCVPYGHDDFSAKLRDRWRRSGSVTDLFFAAATFSPESKLYFSDFVNHYTVARFRDSSQAFGDLGRFKGETIFVFVMPQMMMDRGSSEGSFISFYYARYDEDSNGDEMAEIFQKRQLVARAERGYLKTITQEPPRFTFPYQDSIVALVASGEKSPQGLNQYCEKTKTEMARHGISLSRMVSVSILERLK